MPTNLTGSTIASTFDQLLHVDDGPTATEKTVYSGTGVATALKVGTTSASVDNVQIDGNTVRTLDSNGNLVLSPNGTGSVAIAKAAITGGSVIGITDLAIADGGTGASTAADARTNLGLGSIATQASNNVSITGGTISGVTFSGTFSGITSIEATTFATSAAAAGTNLSGNTLAADGTDANIDINITPKGTGRTVVGALSATSPRVITGVNDTNGNELLKVTATASAVNEMTLANAATGNGPTLSATGDDTNIDINITPKGTGEVNVTNIDVLSGKVPFDTITGRAYAAFSDITDQTGSTTVPAAVKFGTTEVAGSGITMVTDGSNLTRLTFTAAGTYVVAPNLQFTNTDTADHDVTIWFVLNGTNITRSATKMSVPKAADGGSAFFQISLYITVTAGQYVQVFWLPENVAVTLDHTAAAAGPPAVPAIPSAIISSERIA